MYKYEIKVQLEIDGKRIDGILLTEQVIDIQKNKKELIEQLKKDGHSFSNENFEFTTFDIIKEYKNDKKADFVHYKIEYLHKDIELIEGNQHNCLFFLMKIKDSIHIEQKISFSGNESVLFKLKGRKCLVKKDSAYYIFYIENDKELNSFISDLRDVLSLEEKHIESQSRNIPTYSHESKLDIIQKIKKELHNKDIRHDIESDKALMKEAKDNKVLILFGASDDLLEMRGYYDDELSANNGFDSKDLDIDSEYYDMFNALDLMLHWSPDDTRSWAFSIRKDLEFSTFDILEDNSIFCTGLIISLNPIVS